MKKAVSGLMVLLVAVLFLVFDVSAQDDSVEHIRSEIQRHRESIKRLERRLHSNQGMSSGEEGFYEDEGYEEYGESYSEEGDLERPQKKRLRKDRDPDSPPVPRRDVDKDKALKKGRDKGKDLDMDLGVRSAPGKGSKDKGVDGKKGKGAGGVKRGGGRRR